MWLFALAGCQKSPVAQAPAPASAAETPIPSTPPPTAPIAVATPPPATPSPQLAPPGVFYLIQPARIETADGIVGLKPGTGLKLIRPGVYLSPYGEVNLAEEQVTNDLGVARGVLAADQNAQAALKASLVAQAQQAAEAEQSRAVASNAAVPQTARRGSPNPNTGQISALQKQEIAIQAQIDQISTQMQQEAANRHAAYFATGRRSVDASTLPARRRDLETQIQQIHARIRLLETR